MSLGERWAAFYSAGGPRAPCVVVEEVRRAFYGGGVSMMSIMLARAEQPESFTDAGARNLLPIVLEELRLQYRDYAEKLLLGAGAEQLRMTALAFAGGGVAMFGEFLIATEPEDEDVCVQRMEALQRELDDYNRLFSRRHGI